MLGSQICGTTVCYPLSLGTEFSLERALAGIAGAGLQAVELVSIDDYCLHVPLLGQPDSRPQDEVRDRVARFGLVPVALNVNADLTTRAGVERLRAACHTARLLGIPTVVTGLEQTDDPQSAAAFYSLIDQILACLEESGTRLALETHGGLLTTGTQGEMVLRQIGSRFIGLAYDTANTVYWGGVDPQIDLARVLDASPEVLFHVHLKDKASWTPGEYDFPAYGQGVIDLPRIIYLLDEARYASYVAVEVELDGVPGSPEQVDQALRSSLAYLNPLLATSTSAGAL